MSARRLLLSAAVAAAASAAAPALAQDMGALDDLGADLFDPSLSPSAGAKPASGKTQHAAASSSDPFAGMGGDLFDPALTGDAPAAATPAAPAAAPASKGFAQDLANNITYAVEASSTFYPQGYSSTGTDDDLLELWSAASFKTHGSLNENLVVKLKGHAIGTTDKRSHEGAFREPGSRNTKAAYLDLDQASLTYEQSAYQLLAGKDEFETGISTLFSPANRFNPGYGAYAPEAFNSGVWQARADLFIDNDVLQIAALPFDERGSVPGAGSRWLGGGNYYFASLPNVPANADLKESWRDPTIDNWNYVAHYKATRQGYDWFALVHRGGAAYPVIRQVDVPGALGPTQQYHVVYPDVWSVAGGATTTIDRWEFHGEAIYQKALNDVDQDYMKYVVGFSYRETDFANSIGLDEIQPIVEYAGEVVTDASIDRPTITDSTTSRPSRDTILARLEVRFDSDLMVYTGGTRNLIDQDFAVVLGGEYKVSDDLKFMVDAAQFEGRSDTAYGRWTRNDYIKVGAKKTF